MTDYTDLIARLRDNPIENEEAHEAAALESQAKRIAELEERAALLDEHLSQAIGNLKKRDARIEELKKENEDLVLKGLALILLVPDGTKLEEIQKSYERVAAMPARIAELEATLTARRWRGKMTDDLRARITNIIAGEEFPVYEHLAKADLIVEVVEAPLRARIAELEAALKFYQDKDNWKINGPLDANGANFTGGPASDVLEGKDD